MSIITHRPVVGAGAIITDDQERILLIKRASNPEKGKWAVPGGHVDFNESLFDAIKREVKEEVGLDISPEFFTYMESIREDTNSHYLNFYFIANGVGTHSITQPHEVEEIQWFSPEQIKKMDLAFRHSDLLDLFFKNNGNVSSGLHYNTRGKW